MADEEERLAIAETEVNHLAQGWDQETGLSSKPPL